MVIKWPTETLEFIKANEDFLNGLEDFSDWVLAWALRRTPRSQLKNTELLVPLNSPYIIVPGDSERFYILQMALALRLHGVENLYFKISKPWRKYFGYFLNLYVHTPKKNFPVGPIDYYACMPSPGDTSRDLYGKSELEAPGVLLTVVKQWRRPDENIKFFTYILEQGAKCIWGDSEIPPDWL